MASMGRKSRAVSGSMGSGMQVQWKGLCMQRHLALGLRRQVQRQGTPTSGFNWPARMSELLMELRGWMGNLSYLKWGGLVQMYDWCRSIFVVGLLGLLIRNIVKNVGRNNNWGNRIYICGT